MLACLLGASCHAMALLPAGAGEQSAPPRAVLPANDGTDDPEFAGFKARLLAAAESGNVEALIAAMSPDVSYSSEPSTPKSVLEFYGVAPGKPWIALRDALRLGTTPIGGVMVAPALDSGIDHAVIVVKSARLRAAPSERARVLQVLSHMEIVTLDSAERYDAHLVERDEHPMGTSAWARVTTEAGKKGYVFARLLWSAENSRFAFRRVGGQWKLVSIGAGAG